VFQTQKTLIAWETHTQTVLKGSFFALSSFFFIFQENFVRKSGMGHFSGLFHLIDFFKSYKNIYLPNLKKHGHLGITGPNYSWHMICCLFQKYFTNLGKKTQWFDSNYYHIWNQHKKLSRLMRVSIFFEKIFFRRKNRPYSPSGFNKKINSIETPFYSLIMSHFVF